MPLDALLRTVEESAARDAEAVLGDARRRAAEVRRRARERADERRDAAVRTTLARRRRELEERKREQRRDDRRRLLTARRRLLDRVFRRAEERLADADRNALLARLREALLCLPPDGRVVLRHSPRDEALAEGLLRELAQHGDPEYGYRRTEGSAEGWELTLDDGSVRVEISPRVPLESRREELEVELMRQVVPSAEKDEEAADVVG